MAQREPPSLPRLREWAIHGSLFLAFALLLFTDVTAGTPNLHVGEILTTDIVAPHRTVNLPLYEAEQAAAARRVAPIYVADRGAEAAMDRAVEAVLRQVAAAQAALGTDQNPDDQVAVWQSRVGIPLPPADIHELLSDPPRVFADLATDAAVAIHRVLSGASYTADQLDAERQNLDSAVLSLMLPSRAQADFLTAVLREVAQPNMIYSPTATAAARSRAEALVPPPMIEAGQVLFSKGTRVTAADLRLLRALGLDRNSQSLGDALGVVLAACLFLLGTLAYVRRYQRDLLHDRRKVLVTGTVVLLVLFLARVVAVFSPYLIPVAFAAMVVGLTVAARFGLFLSILLVLALTFAMDLDTRVAIVLAVTALAGGLAVSRLRERSGLLWAPLAVSGAAMVTLTATALLGYPFADYQHFWPDLGWAAASGLLSGVLTFGILPFFEHGLGLLSPLRLLELSSPNHPLMKRLLLEAPGTYHHSLIVANLASAGAEAIGADSLLTRVGAYYHDIGKLSRPLFFVDNQQGGENPHDRISPNLSALVLLSHVRDGLALARSARLPPEIQAFIAEHHGTTLMAYFYHRAKELAKSDEVREEDFRYEGPKPQSRETALVMLADGVEAATRAMKARTPGKVEGLVRKLIRDRLLDGQLDESDLTLKDLDVIARAFVHVLAGAYHGRIEYPGWNEMAERRGRLNEHGGHRQSANESPPSA